MRNSYLDAYYVQFLHGDTPLIVDMVMLSPAYNLLL